MEPKAQLDSPPLAMSVAPDSWPRGPAVVVDVSYANDRARVGLVLSPKGHFRDELELVSVDANYTSEYIPGDFAQRELDPLLTALDHISLRPRVVFVDAFVTLDPVGRPGLGAHLHTAGYPSVVGVAKNPFRTAVHAIRIKRGRTATRPLWITSAGVEALDAAAFVTGMPGQYRLPDAMRLADGLSRGSG